MKQASNGILAIFGGSQRDPNSPYELELKDARKGLPGWQRLFGRLGQGPGNMLGGASSLNTTMDLAGRQFAHGGAINDALHIARQHFADGGADPNEIKPTNLPPVNASAPPQSAPITRDMINNAYQTFVGRAANQGELDAGLGMGNFSQVVNGIVNSNDGRNYLSNIDSNGADANQGFNYGSDLINNTYKTYFGRDALADESKWWQDQLNNGEFSALQMIDRIRNDNASNAALARPDLINSSYRTYFGRDPNADEIATWNKNFDSGTTNGQFIDRLMYDQGRTNYNNTGYIQDSYLNDMGRAANQDEIGVWRDALGKGTTRDQMADVIANAGLVNDYYNNYFGRDPNADEANYWVGALGKGTSASDFRNALINDPGYNSYLDQNFLRDEYKGLLGRDPNQDELNYWQDQINKGMDWGAVDRAISADPSSQAYQASNFEPYQVAANGNVPPPSKPRTAYQASLAAMPKFDSDEDALSRLLWSEGEILRNRENGDKELNSIGWAARNRALSGFNEMPTAYRKSHNVHDLQSQILNPGFDGNGAFSYFGKERAQMAKEAFDKDPKLREYYREKARGILSGEIEDPTGGSVAYNNPNATRGQFFAQSKKAKKEGWYSTDKSGVHKFYGHNKWTPAALAAQKAQLDGAGGGNTGGNGGGPPPPPAGWDMGRNLGDEISTGNFLIDQGIGGGAAGGQNSGGGSGYGGSGGTSPHPAPHPAPHPNPPSHDNNHGVTVGPLIDNASGTHYGNDWYSGGHNYHPASGHGAVDPYFGHVGSTHYDPRYGNGVGGASSDWEWDYARKSGGRANGKEQEDDHLDYIKKRLNFREGGNVPSQRLQINTDNIGRAGYATDGAVEGEVSYMDDRDKRPPMMAETPEAVRQALAVADKQMSPHEFVQSKLFDPNDDKQLPQYDPEAGKRTAKEAALTAYGLTDAGGIQQAFGYMPKAEGGFEPSVLDDFKSGNYLAAGLGLAGTIVPGGGKLAKAARKADAVKDATKVAEEVAAPAKEEFKAATPRISNSEVRNATTIRSLLESNGYLNHPDHALYAGALDMPAATGRTWSEIARRTNGALDEFYKMSELEQDRAFAKAAEKLSPYLKKKDGTNAELLSQNGKLAKAQGANTEFDGLGVENWGVNLSPALQWDIVNMCGNSASCIKDCLGKVSGGYAQDGALHDAYKWNNARGSGLAKTIALMQEPEAFELTLDGNVKARRAIARMNGNHLGVRSNIISDVPGIIHDRLRLVNPGVSFYDYTKFGAYRPRSANHHYTYSSTGISSPQLLGPDGKPIRGEVFNEHSNWLGKNGMRNTLDRGDNVSVVVSQQNHKPSSFFDEETGRRYEAVEGDSHDFRPLDKTPDGQPGKIIVLGRKGNKHKAHNAHEKSNGFIWDYDPAKMGDEIRIPDQRPFVRRRGGKVPPRKPLDEEMYRNQWANYDHYREGAPIPDEFKNPRRLFGKG